MSSIPTAVFELLEQFFAGKRKTPEELVKAGVLQEDPRGPPGGGGGKFFNRHLTEVPKVNGVPSVVVDCCNWLEQSAY